MNNNNSRLAHTAEHAFIGSLQKLLGQTLKVRKVEHKDAGANNTAFIQIPQLDLDTVIKAEVEVNSLIALGRRVTTRIFSSLEEAKREIPNLRANEERITAAMPAEVKVVEIENHDLSACTMEHASNLQECDFFLVTRLSKSGSEYQVDFIVGRQAKDTAVALTSKLLRVCNTLRANINTIENTAQKLRSEYEISVRKLKTLSLEKLSAIQPVTNGSVTLLKAVFENLSDDQIQEFAGETILNPHAIVLLANVSDERANVVFARNEKMEEINMNEMFKRFAGIGARGGGKPHFVTGIIKKQDVSSVLDNIAREILG
ncbi:MAG: DHHA1 domain-containing protein [Thermoproteota archaeon]|nr:DHHA1 domain-containing protein [Thermoproteota archaeon]